MLFPSLLCTLALANVPTANTTVGVDVSGQYLEIRTCDVYTGPCFANAECGIVGREAALAWKVDRGAIGGVDVAGLAVVAVLTSDATFGNPYETATDVKSVLLLDAKADAAQRDALRSFATAQLEPLRARVTNEHVVAIELATGCRHGIEPDARIRDAEVRVRTGHAIPCSSIRPAAMPAAG